MNHQATHNQPANLATLRSGVYRYGFQAQEQDKELWEGAVSFKYRVEDARLGRFFSVDPLLKDYPWNSSYAFCENRVIDGVELEGLEYHHYSLRETGAGYLLEKTSTEHTRSTAVAMPWGIELELVSELEEIHIVRAGFSAYYFSSRAELTAALTTANWEEFESTNYLNCQGCTDANNFNSYLDEQEELRTQWQNVGNLLATISGIVGSVTASGLRVPSATNPATAGIVSRSFLKGAKYDRRLGTTARPTDFQFKKSGSAEEDFHQIMKDHGIDPKSLKTQENGVRAFKVDKTTYTLRPDSKARNSSNTVSIITEGQKNEVKIRYDGENNK